MSHLLLDTHVWVWSLFHEIRLSTKAAAAISRAESILVSPVSIYEIAQKTRLGKWPDMEAYVRILPDLLLQQGVLAAMTTPDIASLAGSLDWDHRDPFDRMIAATAIVGDYDLISADKAFDEVAGTGLRRIW